LNIALWITDVVFYCTFQNHGTEEVFMKGSAIVTLQTWLCLFPPGNNKDASVVNSAHSAESVVFFAHRGGLPHSHAFRSPNLKPLLTSLTVSMISPNGSRQSTLPTCVRHDVNVVVEGGHACF